MCLGLGVFAGVACVVLARRELRWSRRLAEQPDRPWRADDRVAYAPDGTSVPIAFTIPANQAPTSLRWDWPTREWKLLVKAAVPGVDLAARFALPVFAVESEDLIESAPSEPPAPTAFGVT